MTGLSLHTPALYVVTCKIPDALQLVIHVPPFSLLPPPQVSRSSLLSSPTSAGFLGSELDLQALHRLGGADGGGKGSFPVCIISG